MRTYNLFWPHPPSFSLPSPAALLSHPNFSTMFYTKLDLKNAFWSINIQPSVRGTFILSVTRSSGLTSFATRCLPFGWTWSPVLAQHTMLHILEPCIRLLSTLWIYSDDVLLAHPDPHFLMYVTNYATFLLSSAGFLLSPKCHLTPTNAFTWLGKQLSASTGITNAPARPTQLLLHIINLRAFYCSFALFNAYWVPCNG